MSHECEDPKPGPWECTCSGEIIMQDLQFCACKGHYILALYEWYACNPEGEK